MTPELQTKLTRIKAACRRALELSEKATAGPWIDCGGFLQANVQQDAPPITVVDCFSRENEAAFIAHSRTFSPAAAKATLTAIEVIEKFYKWNNAIAHKTADDKLQSIADQWPEESLVNEK